MTPAEIVRIARDDRNVSVEELHFADCVRELFGANDERDYRDDMEYMRKENK